MVPLSRASPPWTAGRPYVTPVWQEWDGDAMWIIPRAKTIFRAALASLPALLGILRPGQQSLYACAVSGRGGIVEGPALMHGEWLEIARRMAVRYLGERGPEYLEPSRVRPRYLVKITPEKTISWEGVEWAAKYIDD